MVLALAVILVADPGVLPWLTLPQRMLFRLGWSLHSPQGSQPLGWFPRPEQFAQALQNSHLFVLPWNGALERGVVIAVAAFLIVLLPALRAGSGLLLTLLLALVMALAQVGAQTLGHLWLPLGPALTLLLLGYAVLLFWLPGHWQLQAAREDAQASRQQLARLWLEQEQPAEAAQALAPCRRSAEVLDLLYEAGIRLEKRRQYSQAQAVFSDIHAAKRRFRDVEARLEALQQVAAGAPVETGNMEATGTLVLTQAAVSRPALGRYEIQRELGRGAMGIVYLGHDPRIDRPVAIKTLNYHSVDPGQLPDLKQRFFREAEAAGRLKHPNIVTVYDVGEERDLAYIAMDYVQGRPLSVFGKPHTLLTVPTVFQLMALVAEALDYAHQQKVIHRDIKPANIIYDPESGDLKVTDFGIAKVSDDSRTRTGSVLGSPLYMSPEQLKGQKVTGASDIYSLGVTLFKLLTAETPFTGDTLANLTYQVLNRKPRSARDIRPELPTSAVRIINRAMQREPGKRFGSAGEMAEQLRRAAGRELGKTTTC